MANNNDERDRVNERERKKAPVIDQATRHARALATEPAKDDEDDRDDDWRVGGGPNRRININ